MDSICMGVLRARRPGKFLDAEGCTLLPKGEQEMAGIALPVRFFQRQATICCLRRQTARLLASAAKFWIAFATVSWQPCASEQIIRLWRSAQCSPGK
jgi:hypothetical protein